MVDTRSTIYVVDDDDFVRDALRTLLKSAGYKVEVFKSAQAFWNWEHHQGEGVLLLDVRMPGMNGLELQRLLADSGVAMPIIFISAHEDIRVREKAMAAGAVAFLQKPFDDQELFDAIHLAFEQRTEGQCD